MAATFAGCISGAQSGGVADRPQSAGTPTPQRLSRELPHRPMFAPTTKFDAEVDTAADLPRLLRQALREAVSGTPRPTHLDLNGLSAEIIETGKVSEAPVISPELMRLPAHRQVPPEEDIARAAAALLAAQRVVRSSTGEGAVLSGARRGNTGVGGGAVRPGRDLAGRRMGLSADAASAVGGGGRQLRGAAGEPDCAWRRSGAVRGMRYRRPGDAYLANSENRNADCADRRGCRRNWVRNYPGIGRSACLGDPKSMHCSKTDRGDRQPDPG